MRRCCFDLDTDGIVRLADCDFLLSSQVSWRIRARPGAMLLDPRAGTRGREMSDRLVKVAATQMACGWDIDANLAKAGSLVRRAAQNGANIILIQELFATPYFCKDQLEKHFELAEAVDDSIVVRYMQDLARELGVVLPISFFERDKNIYYNSLVVADADGSIVSHYRKTHIPDGPGYQEKYYFSPGDTGFVVSETRFGNIGVGICWDQWFPETARSLVLQGAEILFYPTAIGSDPEPSPKSRDQWQRAMQGHAAANMVPIVASNRIGREDGETCSLEFYGSSFIADQTGEIAEEAGEEYEEILLHAFDLSAIRAERASWGLLRDRRPEHYASITGM
jgi:N-carbamoylputrescine amidase